MGGFSIGGLVSGLDSNALIDQLLAIERQPIFRLQDQIDTLENERGNLEEFIQQLEGLRTAAQDFRFGNQFQQFALTSSDDSVATASISSPAPFRGTVTVDVTQLATASVATSGAALSASIDPNAALDSSGIAATIEAGDFTINGETFSVDPATDSLNDIINAINSSGAGVTASFDSANDRVVLENSTPGDTGFINLGGASDTSNILDVLGLTGALQETGGSGSTVVNGENRLGSTDASALLSAGNFAGGAVTAGSFRINGTFINVDPATDSLADVIERINQSDAGVTASFVAGEDQIRLVADNLGSRQISFQSGTSNFLDVANLTTAAQTTGSDAQFSIDGTPRVSNTNSFEDDALGLSFDFTSTGTTTITVADDTDAVIENLQGFLDQFNSAVNEIRRLTSPEEGVFSGDSTVRSIESRLLSIIFSDVGGATGSVSNLITAGFNTGDGFTVGQDFELQIDEDALRELLQDNPNAVASLFTNAAGDGVANQLEEYLEEVSGFGGILTDRTEANGSIDRQIESLQDSIDRIEDRLVLREERLRQEFAQLEQLTASFQSQGAALASLGTPSLI